MNRKKRLRRRCFILLLGIFFVLFVCLIHFRYSPFIREVAENQIINAASEAINDAMMHQLRQGNVDYNQIIHLEKDVNGEITALRTDMGQVNLLKVEIFELIDQLILQMDTRDLGIPLGSVLLPEFFAGKGMILPIKAISLSNSDADFFSTFDQAGINQTLQQLVVRFTVSIKVLTPVGMQDVQVSSDVLIAETVIVGRVPQSYMYLGELSSMNER